MGQSYKKYSKYFLESKKSCTFAAAFRRNRWQELTRNLLCCAGTIQQKKLRIKNWIKDGFN